jgi:hypothetical protein
MSHKNKVSNRDKEKEEYVKKNVDFLITNGFFTFLNLIGMTLIKPKNALKIWAWILIGGGLIITIIYLYLKLIEAVN